MSERGVCERGLGEEFCALAAAGQLANMDREALASHCLHCRLCRDHLSELAFVSAQLLAQAKPAFRMAAGSVERFRARATREGIAMRQPIAGAWVSYGLCSALAMAMLFFMARSVFPRAVPQARVQGAMPAVAAAEQYKPQDAALSHAEVWAAPKRRSRRLQTPPVPVQQGSFSIHFAPRYSLMTQAEMGKPVFDASYPALSGMEMKRLDLFRGEKEIPLREPFGVAVLECPLAASATGCSFDFADNIRQLRFQIPNTR